MLLFLLGQDPCYFHMGGFLFFVFFFAVRSALKADTCPSLALLTTGWMEKGRKKRERGRERETGEITNIFPLWDCNKGAYVSTKKIPWQQKLFN